MRDSMSVDAIEKIDGRENKMKEEIGKYAQGLRDNIEKNNRKNKQQIFRKVLLDDKIQTIKEIPVQIYGMTQQKVMTFLFQH